MVGIKIEECILELEKVKDMDTTYIKQLQQDLPANRKFIGRAPNIEIRFQAGKRCK